MVAGNTSSTQFFLVLMRSRFHRIGFPSSGTIRPVLLMFTFASIKAAKTKNFCKFSLQSPTMICCFLSQQNHSNSLGVWTGCMLSELLFQSPALFRTVTRMSQAHKLVNSNSDRIFDIISD